MAQLVIQGHATKGDEVIKFFKMLGGKTAGYSGRSSKYYYLIDNFGYIIGTTELPNDINFKVFTLEEILVKYPYKVGDKVNYVKYNDVNPSVYTIQGMRWTGVTIEYLLDSSGFSASTKDLQPYKEETMETITIDDFKANTKEWLIDKLHGMIISDAVKTIGNIHDELHKPKYPKTFIEVLNFWYPDRQLEDDYQRCYKKDLIEKFQDLLYARDAYWKIAGDWKPDVICGDLYCIGYDGNVITWKMQGGCRLLAFPTEEMRDAFYENFKDLIEECKELL